MSGTPRRGAIAIAWFWVLISSSLAEAQPPGRPTGDPAVVPTSLARKSEPVAVAVPPRSGNRGGLIGKGDSAAGWWFGPVGIAAALAVVGGISLASKRLNLSLSAARDLGSIGVVGQTRLSSKHAVYLVRVGDRVLIVGAGQGGNFAPLGELTDPAELARLIPRRAARPGTTAASVRTTGSGRSTGFDQRIGDDE